MQISTYSATLGYPAHEGRHIATGVKVIARRRHALKGIRQ
jgi:hypothetical protein